MKIIWPRKKGIKYIIGIDEVGRGPLAGPVTLGFVLLEKEDSKILRQFIKENRLKDSKELKEIERENWSKFIKNNFKYKIVSCGSKQIDRYGISVCIKKSIKRGLNNLKIKEKETLVLLDGSLKAPEEFLFQKTIIKGDTKEPTIALASIVAKVHRDKYMKKISSQYPDYNFHVHKGYGTKKHREIIKKKGLSEEHRESFCRKVV